MTYRFLFINTRKAICSIYKSGNMFYESVKGSDLWDMDYIEISDINIEQLHNGKIVDNNGIEMPPYDVYIFNYHHATMRMFENVMSENFHKLLGIKMTIVMEMEPNNPTVHIYSDDFNGYIVLDPTMKFDDPRFHFFPRPLPEAILPEYVEKKIPVIGSFGLPTLGKGFDKIVQAVNKEFDKCIIKLNLPHGTYTMPYKNLPSEIEQQCRSLAKTGIEIIVTNDFMSDSELVEWCSNNTANAFMYDRDMPGLAAATDQAIMSGRPVIVSDNKTFRHIHSFQPSYPLASIRDTIANGTDSVKKMQRAWSYASCQQRLAEIIFDSEENKQ